MNETQRRVREMWEANYPTRDIGAALGMTKNAVCGMLKRMRDNGIALSPRSSKPPVTRQRVKKIAECKKVKTLRQRPVKTQIEDRSEPRAPVVPLPEPPKVSGPVTILRLHSTSCRFIVGGGRGASVLYCGAPKARKSYCAEHYALCYRRDD